MPARVDFSPEQAFFSVLSPQKLPLRLNILTLKAKYIFP